VFLDRDAKLLKIIHLTMDLAPFI